MKFNQRTILIDKKEIQYTHIENGGQVVCFMFSGAGYTYDKPLFYYSTMTMLENQYDVVHIHYSYGQDILKLPLENISNIMANDINPVISEVLKNQQYQETMFLGKSLGTIPIINGFMKNDMYMNSKMILLTPLLKFDSISEALLISNHSALIVIGEKDTHYFPGKIDAFENKSNIKIEKVPNANHSLNTEPINTLMSTIVLQEVMKKLDEFIKN